MLRRWSLGVFVLLAACGGGAAAPSDPDPLVLDLGLLSSVTSTGIVTAFTNPLSDDATVTLVEDAPRFTISAPTLPLAVGGSATFDLTVLFRPNAVGPESGTIRLDFSSARHTVTQEVQLSANAEVVQLQVLTASIDFGEVLPDTSKDAQIDIQNLSTVSRGEISPVTLPAGFALLTPLPVFIDPGATASLDVRYAPTAPGAPTGNILLGSNAPTALPGVPVSATTGGQEIVDFGTLTMDPAAAHGLFTARAPAQTFELPADAISFTVEAYSGSGTQLALSELTGPGGENFEDEDFGGHYLQYPDVGAFAALVPNADQAIQQIIPGTWTVRIGRMAGGDTDVDVRVIIERRPGPNAALATLDLNVFLADAIAPTAADAATNATMLDIWSRVNVLLAPQGIRIGEITYYDLDDPAYDDVTNAEFPALLAESANATEERFNYFFVRTAIGGGILGVSAKLGGTTRKGTDSSGVMGLWVDNPSASQADLVARVTAHEMGHYLGLRHTAESSGANDSIDDTTNFGAGGGGTYLMHWNAGTGGSEISNGQGAIIRGHAHMKAALPSPTPITAKPTPPPPAFDILVPQNWCGTCARCKSKLDLLAK